MSLERLIVMSCASFLAVGCADTKPERSTTEQGLERSAPGLPGDDRAAANDYERRMKKESADPTPTGPTPAEIDWDDVAGTKRVAATALPESEHKKLAEVRVPMLAFDDDALLATGRVSHNVNWYVLAVEGPEGLNMNVRGTRNEWRAPNMKIPQAARDAAENYTLTRTHRVVTVSWRSFGASYSLDLECAKPDDARCAQDDYPLQVAESLAIIGGTQ